MDYAKMMKFLTSKGQAAKNGGLAMNNLFEAQQQAVDLIMQLDDISTEIFIKAVEDGYFKQHHTETEAKRLAERQRKAHRKEFANET